MRRHGRNHTFRGGCRNRLLPAYRDWRVGAAPDAGHALDTHMGSQRALQRFDKLVRTAHRACHRITDAHGERRRLRGRISDNIEMMVERRDLVHLGHRQPQLVGVRRQMLDAQAAIAIIDAMQALQQHVAPARHVAKGFLHRKQRSGIGLTALGLPALAFAPSDEINTCRVIPSTHASQPSFEVAI
ncbi:MAG: hypothetical protein ABI389_10815 [Rhodanobacter sp.]